MAGIVTSSLGPQPEGQFRSVSRKVTLTLGVFTILSVLNPASACTFGPDCTFPCRCAGMAPCDPDTGACPGACANSWPQPDSGWKGIGCQTGNHAYNKLAFQYYTYRWYDAERATEGSFGARCQISNGPTLSWWLVPLHRHTRITTIRVGNCESSYYWYTRHLQLFVSNTSLPWVSMPPILTEDDLQQYGYHATCGKIAGTLPRNSVTTVRCDPPLIGKFVTVWKYRSDGEPDGSTMMSQVTADGNLYESCDNCISACNPVFGCIPDCPAGKNQTTFCVEDCDDGYYDINCREECSPHCLGGSVCDKVDGTCPSGCDIWWTGSRCVVYITIPVLESFPLEVFDETYASATVRWSPLEVAPGLEPYYGYQLWLSQGDTGWQDVATIAHTPASGDLTFTIFKLTRMTQYTASVAAFRKHQFNTDEFWKTYVNFTTPCKAPYVSGFSLLVHNYCQLEYMAQVTVSWRLLTEAMSGCSYVESYQVGHTRLADGTSLLMIPVGNTTNVVTFNVTMPGQYEVELIARNDWGTDKTIRTVVNLHSYDLFDQTLVQATTPRSNVTPSDGNQTSTWLVDETALLLGLQVLSGIVWPINVVLFVWVTLLWYKCRTCQQNIAAAAAAAGADQSMTQL